MSRTPKKKKEKSMMKNYETLAAANKDVLDACMQFNAILTKGFQEIGSHVFALAQSTAELNAETGKAAMSIRSPQELIELQSKWLRQFLGMAVSGSAKLSEISSSIASQTSGPIQSHVSNALDKMSDSFKYITSKAA
jgi:phasin family protein